MARKRVARIVVLAAICGVGAGASAADGGAEAAAMRRVLDLLEAPWQRQPTEEELDQAVVRIRAAADRAIDVLRGLYEPRDQEFAFRHRTVQILERLATPKAQTFLLDIALGKMRGDLASQMEWASRAYVATLKDIAAKLKVVFR